MISGMHKVPKKTGNNYLHAARVACLGLDDVDHAARSTKRSKAEHRDNAAPADPFHAVG